MIELHDQNRELAATYLERFGTGWPVFQAPVDPDEQREALEECLRENKQWGELHPLPPEGTVI